MRVLSVLVAVVSLVSSAEAKNLYVNPTHPSANDATTWANNSATQPWRTIQRALLGTSDECSINGGVAAVAGDVVIVSPGTYTESSPTVCGAGNFQPTFRPANSGTAGSPILIRCETEGGCTLRATGGSGPTFGVLAENYITWRGFVVSASTGVSVPKGDTGVVTVSSCTGCIFENNTMSAGNRIWPMDPDGTPSVQINIVSSTSGNPAVFTTSGSHGLVAGNAVIITGHTNLTSSLGFYYVNTATATTFTLRHGNTNAIIAGVNGTGGFVQVTDRNTNTNVFRANNTTGLVLRNNTISGVYTAGNGSNGACVMTYAAVGLLFEHNTIFDCGANIHLKGGGVATTADDCFNCTIRFNLLYNCGIQNEGDFVGACITLHVGAVATQAQPLRIYQNVMRDSIAPCMDYHTWDPDSPAAAPRYIQLVNNTFDNCVSGIFIGASWASEGVIPDPAGYILFNNIFTNMDDSAFYLGPSEAAISDMDRWNSQHNVFFNTGSAFARVDYEGTPTNYATLANWKTGVGQDTVVGAGAASAVGDPLYVNYASRDLRPQAAFVNTIGVDFLDLDNDGSVTDVVRAGAYITGAETIGRTDGVIVPSAPTNLRIVPQ